ncbi:MAG: hypothetical protein JXM70_26705, partial [Pirellulales bacterium]|nr:hypothetical protein [Pirellulales bacterium]
MDRLKSYLQPRLVAPLVILSSALVNWGIVADEQSSDVPKLLSKSSMETPLRPISLQRYEMPVTTPPSAPWLSPYVTLCNHLSEVSSESSHDTVRSVDCPIIDESADLPLTLTIVEDPVAARPEKELRDEKTAVNESVVAEQVTEKHVVEKPIARQTVDKKPAFEMSVADESVSLKTVNKQPTTESFDLELPSPPPINAKADENLACRETHPAMTDDQSAIPQYQYPSTGRRMSEPCLPEAPAKSADPAPAEYSWLLEGQAEVPAQTRCRSKELELIAQQADAHTRRGFDLAGRRAYFSARTEFIQALR